MKNILFHQKCIAAILVFGMLVCGMYSAQDRVDSSFLAFSQERNQTYTSSNGTETSVSCTTEHLGILDANTILNATKRSEGKTNLEIVMFLFILAVLSAIAQNLYKNRFSRSSTCVDTWERIICYIHQKDGEKD